MTWEKSAAGMGPEMEGQEDRTNEGFCSHFLVFVVVEKGEAAQHDLFGSSISPSGVDYSR